MAPLAAALAAKRSGLPAHDYSREDEADSEEEEEAAPGRRGARGSLLAPAFEVDDAWRRPKVVRFIPPSPSAPRNLFAEAGVLFGERSGASVVSHPLGLDKLKRFSVCLGYMPQVAFVPTHTAAAKVQARLAELDRAAQAKVQHIADRFHLGGGEASWCQSRARRLSAALCKIATPGVLREIWPSVLLYFLYTMWVTWYSSAYNWDFAWSAAKQDTIYYPALIMSFLLSFRASDCMARYQQGCSAIFEMQKHMRELAFEVMTKLALTQAGQAAAHAADPEGEATLRATRNRYFRHEYCRLCKVLFVCAMRDLNDSAREDELDLDTDKAMQLQCSLTDAEHACIHVTHSANGHVFRVYLVCSWLLKLVKAAWAEGLFAEPGILHTAEGHIASFKEAWMEARHVAYSGMPSGIIGLLWVLANALNLVLPWEYVTVCQWWTWLPSVFVSTSFFGIVRIADNMENPFGFDDDDIPVWQVAKDLDEDIALVMHYAALDEVAGENLYRSLASQDSIILLAQG